MKNTLNTHDITNALLNDKYAAWSYNGAKALAEYLEQYEEDCGIELELDVVSLRCEFTEYASLEEWAQNYFSAEQLTELLGVDEYEDQKSEDLVRAGELEAQGEYGDAEQIREWYSNDKNERAEHKEETLENYIQEHGQLLEFKGGIIVSVF